MKSPESRLKTHAEVKPELEPKFPTVKIVQLKPYNWKVLRELKIKSLGLESIAFEDQVEGMERYSTRSEDEWREKLDENASSTLSVFAEDDGSYIGMVNGVIDVKGKKAAIEHMYVDPDYRQQSIGRRLLETLLQKLKDRGDIEKAELAVVETQEQARRLYESLGFQKVGEVRVKGGQDTYTEMEMELEL